MVLKRLKKFFSQGKESAPPVGSLGCILTIEDDPTQRMMIQRTLEKKGYRVLAAEDGRQGIEIAHEYTPDLIILDVVMPGINGEEVCKILKNDIRTQDIPVLFLTSRSDPADVIEHFDLGAEIHLTKPINAKELISQVEITLNRK